MRIDGSNSWPGRGEPLIAVFWTRSGVEFRLSDEVIIIDKRDWMGLMLACQGSYEAFKICRKRPPKPWWSTPSDRTPARNTEARSPELSRPYDRDAPYTACWARISTWPDRDVML